MPLDRSGQEIPTGQFRAVVAANRSRRSALRNELVQNTLHPSVGESVDHLQRHALLHIGINHAWHADRPDLRRCIVRKASPLLIGGGVRGHGKCAGGHWSAYCDTCMRQS